MSEEQSEKKQELLEEAETEPMELSGDVSEVVAPVQLAKMEKGYSGTTLLHLHIVKCFFQ
ncbi:MAG: hypothetical protein NC180_05145 [Muribaculaceae bacterium]|nr:hypothetical protein [Muribaculaceae bacterium]